MSADAQAIESAVRFIADHLDEPLTLRQVAGHVHMSEFHFHRRFAAYVGETVGRYVTRRRLETAALRLAYERDRSVTDIALSSGYSSASNFTKAFSAFFGCSPTQLRDPQRAIPSSVGRLTEIYGRDFHPSQLYVLPDPMDVEQCDELADRLASRVRYETAAAVPVACLSQLGGYEVEGVNRTWAELLAAGAELGICGEKVDAYGMVYDSPQLTAPDRCRYDACIPCRREIQLPPRFFHAEIPAGRYAIFPFQGRVADVERFYRTIYSAWFPRTNLAPADLVPVEHYINGGPVDGMIDYETRMRVRPAE